MMRDKTQVLQGPMTDEEIESLRKRNEQRATEATQQLGPRYVCHPANRVQKLHTTNHANRRTLLCI